MPTLVRQIVTIGPGEHLIRFLNLSGDEVLLDPVTVAYAEVLDAVAVALDAVDAQRPLQGSFILETVSPVVALDRSEWLAETVVPLESLRAGNAIPLSLSEAQGADDSLASDVTNLPSTEVEEVLTVSEGTAAAQVIGALFEEMAAPRDAVGSSVKKRKKTKRVFFRWGD